MDTLFPEGLPPGTLLDSWQIDGFVGYGTYGVVYRAHRRGQAASQPVALKLARHPNDLRFGREAELLTRIQHPGVPRLLARGVWRGGPRRDTYPYLVMEWVDGLKLYEWAQRHVFTSREVLRLLAQVARALAATHANQGLHRDVKGDNVLVTPSGEAFLMDFGCGTWEGAAPLTDGILAPGTRSYRSAQALRFHWTHRRASAPQYQATPADDVYALGVMAYRLCTGTYPPLATDPSRMGDDGRSTQEALVPPGKLNPLVPVLEALILRMLSDKPQDRGHAAELAEAMEWGAATAGPEADEPVSLGQPEEPGHEGPPVVPSADTRAPVSPARHRDDGSLAFLPWGVGLLVLIAGSVSLEGLGPPSSELRDGGTGGVADAAVEDPRVSSVAHGSEPSGVSLDMPKEPLPGQRRPPCPHDQINIRGGCWVEVARATPPCGEGSYDWKGACYYPVSAPPRPSTSDKP
ncbi:protein kinase [Stigmatella sp. ncwal1]|uniref:Protein kinase n=1 Tax=Stigmatella ashevillensis TaxID=2995309 RepID=A0ABT5DJ30_9BACT|nr:serine/threonine protein kinase [Stigmatella ashevillena]MDC0713618.1 protein kinase [Stigmatella ashevillena]